MPPRMYITSAKMTMGLLPNLSTMGPEMRAPIAAPRLPNDRKNLSYTYRLANVMIPRSKPSIKPLAISTMSVLIRNMLFQTLTPCF